jgi:hypothetical protein
MQELSLSLLQMVTTWHGSELPIYHNTQKIYRSIFKENGQHCHCSKLFSRVTTSKKILKKPILNTPSDLKKESEGRIYKQTLELFVSSVRTPSINWNKVSWVNVSIVLRGPTPNFPHEPGRGAPPSQISSSLFLSKRSQPFHSQLSTSPLSDLDLPGGSALPWRKPSSP